MEQLERLTEPADLFDADEGRSERGESLVDVGAALVPGGKASKSGEPGKGAFHDPAVARHGGRDRTLCETLHYTGCRPSELLEITPARVDLSAGTIAIRSPKKRRDATGAARIVYRSVPVPPDYLDTAHDLRKAQDSRKRANVPLWPIGRVRV